MKTMYLLSALVALTCVSTVSADQNWYFTPKLGFSAMTGIIGAEYQYKHLAFDLGLPTAGGIRYYAKPDGHSFFAGLYGMGFGYDNDETKDGVAYTHYALLEGGVAGGFRWLWQSRWTAELGLAVGSGEQKWRNDDTGSWRTEHDIFFLPVASVGFAFR